MLSLVLRAPRKLRFWGDCLLPVPSVLGGWGADWHPLAVLRGEPGLEPGRYLYRQPVRSVSTWKCDSLPEWVVVQHPISLLAPLRVLESPAALQEKLGRKLRSKAGTDVLTPNVPASSGQSPGKDPALLISEPECSLSGQSWLFSS